MENFDNFMLHKVKVEYQPNGFSVQFGGGYSFDTDGGYPPLKKFSLTFKGYQYYMTKEGLVDKEKNKNINNLGALEDFYMSHLTHKAFIYNHPVYGPVTVKFAEPLVIPEGITNGHGVVEELNITLKEVFV